MNTRTTSDYTPTRPGSREENRAIVARTEMMHAISVRTARRPKRPGFAAALAKMKSC